MSSLMFKLRTHNASYLWNGFVFILNCHIFKLFLSPQFRDEEDFRHMTLFLDNPPDLVSSQLKNPKNQFFESEKKNQKTG